MWKAVLLPIVLVVAIWFLTSASTTSYLLWLDNSYERTLANNINSIQAVDGIQYVVDHVLIGFSDERTAAGHFLATWPESSTTLDKLFGNLKEAAGSDDQPLIAQFAALIGQFSHQLKKTQVNSSEGVNAEFMADLAQLRKIGASITEVSQKLQSLNYQMLDQAAKRRKNIQGYVFAGRTFLLIAGPALGMWLGWKMSTRLHRSVARLAVTLSDATTHLEKPVASVELIPRRDLGDIQIQADHIVNRIREVSQELDAARREVLQAERLAAVGGLAAGVAHELRNPLTSIKLLLQHACRQSGEITLQESKARLILDEISRLESTIQGLLDFARPPALSRTRHDLRTTLNRGLNLIDGRCRQQQIKVNSVFSDTHLWVNGNSEQLHQVFVNLLINGIEAMPSGGTLSVVAGHVIKGSSVRLEVSDTGTGIEATTLSRLFEPFVTTKEKGTGLGLAISRRIVDSHGGTMRAANRLEGGAIFTVEIPASLHEAPSQDIPETCTAEATS
jgi:two-component system, NtrC family, sensor histidine kinase HydH